MLFNIITTKVNNFSPPNNQTIFSRPKYHIHHFHWIFIPPAIYAVIPRLERSSGKIIAPIFPASVGAAVVKFDLQIVWRQAGKICRSIISRPSPVLKLSLTMSWCWLVLAHSKVGETVFDDGIVLIFHTWELCLS